eukprot:310341-Chlamydomonas_euryale.AAC.2
MCALAGRWKGQSASSARRLRGCAFDGGFSGGGGVQGALLCPNVVGRMEGAGRRRAAVAPCLMNGRGRSEVYAAQVPIRGHDDDVYEGTCNASALHRER